MKKFIKILLIVLISLEIFNRSSVLSATLKCEFSIDSWTSAGSIYQCKVQNNGIFKGSHLTIDSIEGDHLKNNTNTDVKGLRIYSISNVSYFPVNIEKYFPNLIAIYIYNSQLQEITQNDLKVFPNLMVFRVYTNNIKIIEKDTFKFNPLLKYIDLDNNQISHIDYEVFSALSHLEKLDLANNKCKKTFGNAGSRAETLNYTKRVEAGDCFVDVNQIIRRIPNLLTSKVDELRSQSEIINGKIDTQVNKLTQKFNENSQAYHDSMNKKFNESEAKISALSNKVDKNQDFINEKFNKITKLNNELNAELKIQMNNLSNKLESEILQNYNESRGENKKLTAKLDIQADKMNSEFSTLMKTLNGSFSEIVQNENSTADEMNQITHGMIIFCSIFILLIIIVSIVLIKILHKLKMTSTNESYKMKKLKQSNESDTVNNPIYEDPTYCGSLTTCTELSE